MLLIGVDEAGYGPLLGPLAVAGAAFRLPDEASERVFPARLEAALEASGLAVGDSKQVYGAGGLLALERTVLAFAHAAGARISGLDELLSATGGDAAACRAAPWYAGPPPRFPWACPAEEPALLGDAVARVFPYRFLGFAAEVLPEAELNARFERTGNKAAVLFDSSATVAERLLAHAEPGEPVVVVFDRQGGRRRYLDLLQQRFDARWVWILAESRERSSYRLDGGDAPWTMRFEVGADDHAPQVGLASMLAKYLRESFMLLWNGWFAGLCPDVRPTAGYTQDGRRWLEESAAARAAAGIPDARLVRTR